VISDPRLTRLKPQADLPADRAPNGRQANISRQEPAKREQQSRGDENWLALNKRHHRGYGVVGSSGLLDATSPIEEGKQAERDWRANEKQRRKRLSHNVSSSPWSAL
jgi:hypothetical protein